MELYVAIPRAITDIYSNGWPKTSQALGMFCVKLEIKKGLLGNLIITGFQEVITGEKISNRKSYITDFDTIKYKGVDCIIEKEAQIGDLAWEIVDESTADRLLSPEKLKEYMSLTPEEVHEQLKSIRTKARSIGQMYTNLEAKGRFKKKDMNSNQIYVAIPKAITDIYWNGLPDKSQALGMFCVKPEIKKGLLGKLTVTGFQEVITGEKISNRKSYITDFDTIEYRDVDCMIEKKAQIGDLAWDIVDKSTADRLLSPEELKEYMSLTPEEIHEQLKSIRTKAKSIKKNKHKVLK